MNSNTKLSLLGHKNNAPSSLTPMKTRAMDAKSYFSDSGMRSNHKPPLAGGQSTSFDYRDNSVSKEQARKTTLTQKSEQYIDSLYSTFLNSAGQVAPGH